MKKVNIILLIIALGIVIGIGASNELINSIPVENNVNGATSSVGANYSGIIKNLESLELI